MMIAFRPWAVPRQRAPAGRPENGWYIGYSVTSGKSLNLLEGNLLVRVGCGRVRFREPASPAEFGQTIIRQERIIA
jgi:hypothetical protein